MIRLLTATASARSYCRGVKVAARCTKRIGSVLLLRAYTTSQVSSHKKPVITIFREHACQSVCEAAKSDFTQTLNALQDSKDKNFDFQLAVPRVIRGLPSGAAGVAAAKAVFDKIPMNDWIQSVLVDATGDASTVFVLLSLHRANFASHVLRTVHEQQESYGEQDIMSGKRVVVEYSSPNVAKPFHAGHLRSTILGSFLVNLHRTLGATVTSINYLGDYGTQFGLLAVGFQRLGSEEKLAKDPIRHLFEVYVAINQLAERDDEVNEAAKTFFKSMEDGDEKALALWRKFRDLSIEDYKRVYKRLGVQFDVYSGESQQSAGMARMMKELEERNLLVADERGGFVIPLKKHGVSADVVVKKSDGASLYITRDLVAAKSRYDEFQFDKSLYVVATQQLLHFQQLFKTLELLGYPWAKNCVHINFGMVKGMKTRKGQVVFLEDILNEAQSVMLNRMKEDRMGKLEEIEDPEGAAAVLGLSAVVIQDLSARRVKDYEFTWDRMTSSEGHTGVYLQYAHARLSSIEAKTENVPLSSDVDYGLLSEPEARELIVQVARYPVILQQAAEAHEPCTLVQYLFELCNAVAGCHRQLKVIGAPSEGHAKARKLLFNSARLTLGNALRLLGLQPLIRM